MGVLLPDRQVRQEKASTDCTTVFTVKIARKDLVITLQTRTLPLMARKNVASNRDDSSQIGSPLLAENLSTPISRWYSQRYT
jgi:hypothetical protein